MVVARGGVDQLRAILDSSRLRAGAPWGGLYGLGQEPLGAPYGADYGLRAWDPKSVFLGHFQGLASLTKPVINFTQFWNFGIIRQQQIKRDLYLFITKEFNYSFF
jgi:hypothetical protein